MMRRAVLLITTVVLLKPLSLEAQPADPLGGASRPKPDMSLRRDDQYKRVHQVALRYILLERYDEAEAFLNQYRDEHPEDAETHFMLGLLNVRRGRSDAAQQLLQQAVELGLPEGRLVAGPRQLLQPLQSSDLLQNTLRRLRQVPIHGPLLGDLTDSSAAFWVRTAEPARVTVRIYSADAADSADPIAEAQADSEAARDYTAVVNVTGLQSDSRYRYSVSIDQGPGTESPDQQFRTFPPVGSAADFRIAFGGGAGYVPENERMWNTIHSFDPQALLLLGDNVYIDDPESAEMQQYTYYRRQARPEWRSLTAGTAVFTIWDDHDFSTNDSWGGPLIDVPAWKTEKVFPIFRQNWANPGYAGGDAQPGCWYSFRIADVDFIMLDCRYYRTSPRSSNPSMLGPIQLQWLQDQLTKSQGTFKVICSSVPWDYRTKGDSLDTWNGFQDEREQILSFIEQQRIPGVVLMSADRHRSDAWYIERPQGYGFYEFNSSRLTNQHVHPTMEKAGAIFSYNKPQSFGLVTFDTTAEDPQVRYDVVNIDGQIPHSLTVRLSELQF